MWNPDCLVIMRNSSWKAAKKLFNHNICMWISFIASLLRLNTFRTLSDGGLFYFHNEWEMVSSKLLEVKFKWASFDYKLLKKTLWFPFKLFIYLFPCFLLYCLGIVLIGYCKLRICRCTVDMISLLLLASNIYSSDEWCSMLTVFEITL